MEPEYQLIETFAGLEAIIGTLETEKAIAVDLEADSMFHFREQVCLLQIAAGKVNAVIDPLQIKDLSPLKRIFENPDIKKIFHGADYDVRSLYRDFNYEINNLFDTQLASKFLGIRQTGLESVLQVRFNVSLDKKYQRKDWSMRPLPEAMISYAANDARYLLPLAEILEKELAAMGRLSWVVEECEYLSRVRPMQNDHDPLFLNFKGAGRLDPKSLAVLEALLAFRRKLACKKNRPLFKIFSHKSLMTLAVEKPDTIENLEKTKTLSSRQVKMYGDNLIAILNTAKQTPVRELPVYPRRKAPVVHPATPDRIKLLKNWRDKKARKLKIEPGMLINKNLLTAIAVRNPSEVKSLADIGDLKQWQISEFGSEIIAALHTPAK
jgi:ribonuclease D